MHMGIMYRNPMANGMITPKRNMNKYISETKLAEKQLIPNTKVDIKRVFRDPQVLEIGIHTFCPSKVNRVKIGLMKFISLSLRLAYPLYRK